jgi:hypothetical protein
MGVKEEGGTLLATTIGSAMQLSIASFASIAVDRVVVLAEISNGQ